MKKLLKQALDALDEAVAYTSSPAWSSSMTEECKDMVMKLRTALEQPKPEPVGYLLKNSWDFVPGNEPPEGDSDAVYMEPPAHEDEAYLLTIAYLSGIHAGKKAVYVPLTDEKILKIARAVADKKIDLNQSIYGQFGLQLARAIEKAVRNQS